MSQSPPAGDGHTRRDADTLRALGIFMTGLSLPVFAGTPFAEKPFDMAVNFVCACMCLAIGVGMILRGRALFRSLD